MKLFTATTRTQGVKGDDFFFCNPGELVHAGFQCCNCTTCGCSRSLVGLTSHRGTTTFQVDEVRISLTGLAGQVYASWQEAGYKSLKMADAIRDAKQLKFWASHFEVGDVCGWDGTTIYRRARNKPAGARFFPELDEGHWCEIYNALDISYPAGEPIIKGAALRLPPDGEGMAGNEELQAKLSEGDWVEIRMRVGAKYDRLKQDGDNGDDFISRDNMREWKAQMRHILKTLEVIGVKAA